jgi:L-cysteate sulfo-lyase
LRLADFPRIGLAHLPTPLEHLPRLSEALGGPNIWVKRDDCTGLGGGGSKTRKLDFLMAAARQQGADTIITLGALQSNHTRLTAAAAAKLGMSCHLLLTDIAIDTDRDYRGNGNFLLNRIFGAHLHRLPSDSDLEVATESLVAELRETGRNPYVIPSGGSNALGALGYVDCAFELVAQTDNQQLSINHVVLATGSGGTQAGLLVGLHLQKSAVTVLGICTGRSAPRRGSHQRRLFGSRRRGADAGNDQSRVPRCAHRRTAAGSRLYGKGHGRPGRSCTPRQVQQRR